MHDDFADIRGVLEGIQSSPFFLGSQTFLHNVQFHNINSYTEVLVEKPPGGRKSLRPAKVELVGRIDEFDFRLVPCGGWRPGWKRRFEETKAIGIILPPIWSELSFLWREVSNNLSRLPTLDFPRADVARGNSILTPGGGVKLRHTLFVPPNSVGRSSFLSRYNVGGGALTPGPEESDTSSTSTASEHAFRGALSSPFNPDEWVDGCLNIGAKLAMRDVFAEQLVRPNQLPAYDQSHVLLRPHQYHKMLPGALVYAIVTISCQYLNIQGTVNVYADIDCIRILRPKPTVSFENTVSTSDAIIKGRI
ncbi:hypothetical protein K474DRAFT_1709169 [Panus rudis PR-1116 ss-1]|nr:hypothetical protein K474DRAFT_1709169 [Panus rudis PR-1116 ss-1]